MKIGGNRFYFTRREEWRKWLEENFNTEKDAWLIYPNKQSGKPRISYNDAVEEALCFGWIDSIHKSLKKNHSIQRYSPRKKGSPYSQPNIERLKLMIAADKIHQSLVAEMKKVVEKKFIFPPDILKQIKADKDAWKYYQSMPESYQRIRIAYIHGARNRPEEFEKRLRNFIEKTRKNELVRSAAGMEIYY